MTVPLPAHELPGLEPLINGGLWAEWADAGRVFPIDGELRAAVRYFRFKPDATSRLFVGGAVGGSGLPEGFLVQLFPDVAQARSAFAKLNLLEPVGSFAPILVEEHALTLQPFPVDRDLPSLAHLHRPDAFRRTLLALLPEYASGWRVRRKKLRLELLTYKPGRRAVYRVDVRLRPEAEGGEGEDARAALHLKVEAPLACARDHAVLSAIHGAAGERLRVPTPRPLAPGRDVVACDWIEGAALRDAGVQAFRQAGGALAVLHDLDPAALPGGGAPRALGLQALAQDLARLLPERAEPILTLGERLAREVACLPGGSLVHGDFHPGQVLVADGEPVLVDFDRAGVGARALDVGNFLATYEEGGGDPARSEAFLAGYADGAAPLDSAVLALARAVGWFRRAAVPFRSLEPDWPQRVSGLLDVARRAAEEAGA